MLIKVRVKYTVCKTKENGKDSGKSGSGGSSGYVGVFTLKFKNISHLIYDNSMSRLGINGNHGHAGLGGFKGNSYERIYFINEIPLFEKIFFGVGYFVVRTLS